MPTDPGVRKFFERLILCGVPLPAALEGRLNAAVQTWLETLADVSDAELELAALRITTAPTERDGHRFWPTTADVRRALGLGDILAPQSSASRRMDADAAWGMMLVLSARNGREKPPQIGDTPEPTVSIEYVNVPGRPRPQARRVFKPGVPRWSLSDEPATCAAMEAGLSAIGGWGVLCDRDSAEQSLGPAFRRAYQAEMARGDVRAAEVLRLAVAMRPDRPALATAPTADDLGLDRAAPTLAVLPGGRTA